MAAVTSYGLRRTPGVAGTCLTSTSQWVRPTSPCRRVVSDRLRLPGRDTVCVEMRDKPSATIGVPVVAGGGRKSWESLSGTPPTAPERTTEIRYRTARGRGAGPGRVPFPAQCTIRRAELLQLHGAGRKPVPRRSAQPTGAPAPSRVPTQAPPATSRASRTGCKATSQRGSSRRGLDLLGCASASGGATTRRAGSTIRRRTWPCPASTVADGPCPRVASR